MGNNVTIEGNKMIAEFMGAKKEQWYPPNKDNGGTGVYLVFPQGKFPANESYHNDTLLKYHTSWDWLMPVVGKIKEMYKPYKYKAYEEREEAWEILELLITNPINEVYDSSLLFIQWYNKKDK